MKKGDIDDAVSEYEVDRRTGDAVFCSHGGYCYPRFLRKNGKIIEVLRLLNCKIGSEDRAISQLQAQVGDNEHVVYDVDVDRSKNSASDLQVDDVDNALLNMGMSQAAAWPAADAYVKHPASPCGSAVGNALGGDKAAIAALQKYPSPCDEKGADLTPAAASGNAAPASPGIANDGPHSSAVTPSPRPVSWLKIALALAALLYFVPSFIAFIRGKRDAKAILALNLFLGWSFLGWVAAIIWSLLSDERRS